MAVDLHRARARYAYLRVADWKTKPDVRRKIAGWLPGLPVLIRTQGLLVTLCMLRKDEARDLDEALANWILGKHDAALGLPKPLGAQPRGDVIELCTTVPRSSYQAAQREALALAELLKLMAAAHGLKDEG